MNAYDYIAYPRMCPTCRGSGKVFRKPGGIDACPDCSAQAELEYQDIISELKRMVS